MFSYQYYPKHNNYKLISDPCDGCRMENGAGFNIHPTECDKFVQCYFGHGSMPQYSVQDCPWGNFWDQDSMTCSPAMRVTCPNGRLYELVRKYQMKKALKKCMQIIIFKRVRKIFVRRIPPSLYLHQMKSRGYPLYRRLLMFLRHHRARMFQRSTMHYDSSSSEDSDEY